MKFIRPLKILSLWTLGIVAFLGIVAISPIAQTWVARIALGRQASVHGTLEALSARFGKVEVTDLRLEFDGGVLTLPSLKAKLPVTRAVWNRKVVAERVVAKGWTLDLSQQPNPTQAQTQGMSVTETATGNESSSPVVTNPTQKCLQAFHELLNEWKLPCDISLDGLELEGDVLIPGAPDSLPGKIHVVIKGDGLAAGGEGAVSIDATGQFFDSKQQMTYASLHGGLVLAVDAQRTMNRLGVKGDLLVKSDSLFQTLTCYVDLTAARGVSEESYELKISEGSRPLASSVIRVPLAKSAVLTGTWKLALRDTDLAPFVKKDSLPTLSTEGEGTFETDAVFTRVHALGNLKGSAIGFGVLSWRLEPLGSVNFDARFDATHSGQKLHFDMLNVSLAGPQPIAVVQSLQPFDLDELKAQIAATEPHKDWLEASITGLPLSWLSGVLGSFTLPQGNAAGKVVVQTADKGFSFRTKEPLTAKGVTVQRWGKVLAHDLDLSLSLVSEYTAAGWQLKCAPFTVQSAGQQLASFEGKALLPSKAGSPGTISGSWKADPKALSSQSSIPGTNWITATAASGELAVKTGTVTRIEGKMAILGPEIDHSITSSFDADIDAYHEVAFHVPVKISLGSKVSEISIAGSWSTAEAGTKLTAMLKSKETSLEHLQQLTAPLAAMGGAPLKMGSAENATAPNTPARKRELTPFWGDLNGHMTVGFDHLKAWGDDMKDVRGIIAIDHKSFTLDNATWELPDKVLVMWKGAISFNPSAELPYTLNASGDLGEVDGASVFGAVPKGKDPLFRGRLAVAKTLKSSGVGLDGLSSRLEEEFRFTSKGGGIIRLLKMNVAESLPEPPTTTGSKILGTMGDVVRPIFGSKNNVIKQQQNHLGKNTEGVLNFSYDIAEFRYDDLAITATRGADRTLHLVEISVTAPDEHFTGSGEIGYVKGQPLSTSPLSVDFKFGARGRLAEFLTAAGLLSTQKDDKGYTLLNQPIHLGGNLEKLDKSQLRDLLVVAATPKPDERKKEEPAAPDKK